MVYLYAMIGLSKEKRLALSCCSTAVLVFLASACIGSISAWAVFDKFNNNQTTTPPAETVPESLNHYPAQTCSSLQTNEQVFSATDGSINIGYEYDCTVDLADIIQAPGAYMEISAKVSPVHSGDTCPGDTFCADILPETPVTNLVGTADYTPYVQYRAVPVDNHIHHVLSIHEARITNEQTAEQAKTEHVALSVGSLNEGDIVYISRRPFMVVNKKIVQIERDYYSTEVFKAIWQEITSIGSDFDNRVYLHSCYGSANPNWQWQEAWVALVPVTEVFNNN
jgi:hypothetical protein